MNFKYLTLLLIPLFFVACDKEEEAVADKNAPSAIEQKIINFKAELTSTSKAEITYTLEEAEWNLEALLNYEEANNEHNYHNLQFEKDVYQVPVINGSISSSDLLAAYTHFLKKIEATTLDETIFSDLVDLTIVEPDSKDGEANIEMMYSSGTIIPIMNYDLFDVNDDWKLGEDWGPCGNNPSNEQSGAEAELEYRFNNPNTVGNTADGYYTNVQSTGYIEPWNFDEDFSNPAALENRTWIIANNCHIDVCLQYDELNFYLSKFDYIKEQRVPSNKTVESVDVDTQLWLGDGKGNPKGGPWFHTYEIYYGDFHIGSGGQQ